MPAKVPRPKIKVAIRARIRAGNDLRSCTKILRTKLMDFGLPRFEAQSGAKIRAKAAPRKVPVTDICKVAKSGANIFGKYEKSGGIISKTISVR